MITNKRVLVNKNNPSIQLGLCADEIIGGMASSAVEIVEMQYGYNLICRQMSPEVIYVKMIVLANKEEFEWKYID